MRVIVDVHAHLFNADDLPVAGFASHSEQARGVIGSQALAELLARVVQGRAPGFETDAARLHALLDGLELAGPDPEAAMAEDEAAARAVLDGDPGLRQRVQESMAELAGSGDESLGPADLVRAVRWVALFAQSRADLPGRYATGTGSGVTLVVPMLVDLDAGTEDTSETTQAQQVELFDLVSLASMRGLLPGAAQLAVHPFAAFDPVRQLRHTGGGESPLELVQRAVLAHGFVGVKVYPPMGWRPTGNVERTDLPPGEGERLDRVVAELAGWCAAHDVPITAHSSDSNYADDAYDDFGAPAHWRPLLEDHPGLRLNLGHFGGSHPCREAYGWTEQIAALMSEHDHLYADVSCHPLAEPGLVDLQMQVMTELADRGHPITTRVMFGTDWYMQAINPDAGSFLDTYRAAWRSSFGDTATDDFMAGNALRFLGLDDPTNQNAQRLGARYDAAEVARPEWLGSMTHFLDTLPLDFSRMETQELLGFLSETYFQEAKVITLVSTAGISRASITWGQPGRELWRDVLDNARNQGRLRVLLEQIAAGPDTGVASRVAEFLAPKPVTASPGTSGSLPWVDAMDPAPSGQLERQLEAEPTLLDIAFLARGLELAPAVARLLVTLGPDRYYGTGFRIGADLLLTNHHVLYPTGGAPATSVEAWFGYERTLTGAAREHTVVRTDPASIAGAADHDWAVIRTLDPLPAAAPVISLWEADQAQVEVDDRVYIIQHPLGGVKKIGMIHNVVRYLDEDVLGYRTDTEGGSSGSPVFDEQWRLVGLHHQWTTRTIDGRPEMLNQGRRIERVRAALVDAGVLDGPV